MVQRSNFRRRDVLKASAGVVAAGTVGLAGCLGDDDDDGDVSYPDEDVTWIVPFGEGGGYDVYSRGIAEHMAAHLPNDVEIVVENHPGAGSRTGLMEVHRADPDGYTVGMIDTFGNAAYQTAIEPDFDDFDIRDFQYFGTAAWEPYTFWVEWDSEFETVDDLLEAEDLTMVSQDPGSAATNSGILAVAELELDADYVFGYDGTAESMTAVLRGDGDLVPVNPTTAQSLYEDEELRPILVFGDEPIEWADEAETAGELGYDGLAAAGRFERALGTGPDVDDEIVDILEDAWLDTAEDDDFIQWSEDNDRPIQPEDGATTQANTDAAVETFEEYRDVFADL